MILNVTIWNFYSTWKLNCNQYYWVNKKYCWNVWLLWHLFIYNNKKISTKSKIEAFIVWLYWNLVLVHNTPPLSTSNHPKQQHRTLTFNNGKTNPTVKLENQFTIVDTDTAADRGPWEKISATMNQGIDPELNESIIN